MATLAAARARVPSHRRTVVSPIWAYVGIAALIAGLAALAVVSASAAVLTLLAIAVALVLAAIPKSGVTYLMAFLAVLFLLPSTLTVSGPLNAIGQPSTILGWGAGVLWIAGRLSIDSGLDRRRNPARWTVLLFLTVVVLAFGVAYTRPLTHLEAQGTVRSVAKIAAYAGMGLLTMDTIRDRRDVDRLLRGLVLGVAFSALVGLIQFRTGFNYIDRVHLPGLNITKGTNGGKGSLRQGLHRVTGTAHHPIEFAVTLTTVLPLALHYAVHTRQPRWRWVFRVLTLIIAVAVPTAISRTGIVGIVVGSLVVAADWSWRRRANALAVGVVGLTIVMVAVPRLLGTVRNLFAGFFGKNSVQSRTSDYDRVQQYLHGHLLLGRGQGTFQVEQYFTLDNQYLNALLASGLVGVVALGLLYLTIVALGRGIRRRARDDADRSLGQALAAGGLVLAFSAATFDLFGFTQALALTFLTLGVSGALWRITWYEHPSWEVVRERQSQPAADLDVVTAR